MLNSCGSPRPRSDLSAVHDGAIVKRNRIQTRQTQKAQLDALSSTRPYGIYRSVSLDAYDQFVAATLTATRDSSVWLRQSRPRDEQPKITMNGDFGATFIGYQSMRNALVRAVNHHGLDVEGLTKDINNIQTQDIRIPILGFEWGGNDNRRLLARFALSDPATAALIDETNKINEILKNYDIDIMAQVPDHTSLVRYKLPDLVLRKQTETKKLGRRKRRVRSECHSIPDLSRSEKGIISEIYNEAFIQRGIGEIALGNLVLGHSYSSDITKPDLRVQVKFSNDMDSWISKFSLE